MIIKQKNDQLMLTNQTDHAELSGNIARAWGNENFSRPALAESAVLAAERHDDGWAVPDSTPAFNAETRRPLHFHEIAAEEHIPLYRKGVLEVADDDSYAGLLVGMHWTGLYRGRWGMQSLRGGLKSKSEGIYELQEEAILEEESRWSRTKHSLLKELDRRSDWEAQLWLTYDMLQVWDLLSLFVCLAPHETEDQTTADTGVPLGLNLDSLQYPARERLIPAPTKLDEELTELSIQVVEPGLVVVDPYPFAEPDFNAEVNAIAIPDRDYTDSHDIAEARRQGISTKLSCVFTNK